MKKRFLWFFALIILLVILLSPFSLEALARFLVVKDELLPADLILVLAGDDNGERVNQGVELYRQGYAKKMLMSGGPLAWHLTSAEWMKKQAISMGVPPEAILLQAKSRSTIEDAELSLPILIENKVNSMILVTSPYHSRRALRVFKKVYALKNIRIISYPARESEFRIEGWWKRHEDTSAVVWELFSLLYYFFKGY